MRFTKRGNNLTAKSFNLALVLLITGGCLLSVACQSKEQKATTTLQRCQTLLDQDRLPDVVNCYHEAMQADPQNAPEISRTGKTAFFKKCVEYKQKSDYKTAIICLEGFTALEPQMANGYFLLADSYYRYFQEDRKARGQADKELLDRAENAVKNGLDIKSDDAGAHSLYGQILADDGKKQNALLEHQTAIKLSPQTYVFWIYFMIAQEKFGDDEEAIKSCYKALAIKSDDPMAYSFLGKLYVKVGKTDEAIETFEKLLKIQPDYDEEANKQLEELKRLRDEKKPKAKAVGRQ